MHISAASEPGGDAPNEDWCGFLPDAVAVLDGVTVRPGMTSGCIHGTPWYVRQLGARVLHKTAGPGSLTGALTEAIGEVAVMHAWSCDLATIGAPSSALAVLRVDGGRLEWLALADVSIALDTIGGLRVISDDRVAESVAGLDATTPGLGKRIGDARKAHRNQPGGYWVAAADPDAARHALTGSVPLREMRRVMVATDGAARLVDVFGSTWQHALDIGPREAIRETRAFETQDPGCVKWPRMKPGDDATAVLWVP